ncbi:hypothetical protein GLOIN_2v1762049 [Rhizophagus irregularis DAOM 181602=DAOM 197198]|nr:hypothetical protein RirG_108310 [Rhizophagus irregularis DAOM 197198w]GBC30135.1 hypothetical protein GLOIN_2v1762049 [Rhizophagus irregularis DAOM 181602=DAOM 197198]
MNTQIKIITILPSTPVYLMKKDFVADSAADTGGSNITPSQQKNTDNTSSTPFKDSVAPTAPGSNMFGTDMSMYAPKDKETFP